MAFLRSFFISGLVAVVLAAFATAADAEVKFPPGMRIGLEPPADMTLSTHFPGFEDADRKVSIHILDLPAGAYGELETSAFNKNQPGLDDVKRESFPFQSGIAFLISGHGEQNGAIVYKWFLLAKASGPDQNLATLVNVEVPEAARSVYTDALIRQTLASVTFRPAPIQEQLAMLPFKLDDLGGFRVMQALAAGGVILTDGPTDDLTKQPYMIVSVGRGGPQQAGDRARFARDLLQTAPVRDMSVTFADAIRISGAPGFEIRATANGLHGEPISIVQWVRFGTSGFLRVIGVSRPDAWDALFPRFRTVRDGIDLR
jgi:hypothetical protein